MMVFMIKHSPFRHPYGCQQSRKHVVLQGSNVGPVIIKIDYKDGQSGARAVPVW